MTTGIKTKRFYKSVSVESAADGFGIMLDGRPIRTPAGKSLTLPHLEVAKAVAAEWESQVEFIQPHTMPMTQLSNSALDRVPAQRQEIRHQILAYAETDTLCYWAESPVSLVESQRITWQPLLDWAADRLGARLTVTIGISSVGQDQDALLRLELELSGMSDIELAVIAAFAACTGSLIVPLAVRHGRLNHSEAFEVSLLEELYQVEKWGEDADAAVRRQRLREDMAAYAHLLACCRDDDTC